MAVKPLWKVEDEKLPRDVLVVPVDEVRGTVDQEPGIGAFQLLGALGIELEDRRARRKTRFYTHETVGGGGVGHERPRGSPRALSASLRLPGLRGSPSRSHS